MSFLSLIAFVFGTAGVLLTIKRTVWCWPVSLVAVVSSTVEFFQARLFGDAALQVFYLGAGIYGWYYWNKREKKVFKVERIKKTAAYRLLFFTLLQAGLYYLILKKLKGDQVVLDSVLTAASLSATYMMTKRWLENWSTWVAIDAAYVWLYALKGLWVFAVLYLFFAAMAFYGWMKWRVELEK